MNLPSIKKVHFLTREEERKLLIKSCRGDKEARNFLIENNQFLVVKIARGFFNSTGTSLSMEDLIQEGNIGLIKAVDNFNIRKKVRLSTYATYSIHRMLTRAIFEKIRIVRIPEKVQCTFFNVITGLNNKKNFKISKRDIKFLKVFDSNLNKDSVLGGSPVDINNIDLFGSHVPKKDGFSPVAKEVLMKLSVLNTELESNLVNSDIENYFLKTPSLTELQRQVIILKIGLYDSPKTNLEISKILGIGIHKAIDSFELGIMKIKHRVMENYRDRVPKKLCN